MPEGFSLSRYGGNETKHIQTKDSKSKPVVVKSDSESNCKRSCKSAILANFNLKPKTEMKKLNQITKATTLINTKN